MLSNLFTTIRLRKRREILRPETNKKPHNIGGTAEGKAVCLKSPCSYADNSYVQKENKSEYVNDLSRPMEKSKKEDLTEKIESVASQVDELAKPGSDRTAQGTQSPQVVATGEEVINWDQLISLLGDVELVKEVVPVFLNDNKERFEELSEAVKLGDAAAIKLYAHGIKGAGRNVGAKRLSDIANQMECAGGENDVESARPLFDELRIEFEKVMSAMSDVDWAEIAKRQANTGGG